MRHWTTLIVISFIGIFSMQAVPTSAHSDEPPSWLQASWHPAALQQLITEALSGNQNLQSLRRNVAALEDEIHAAGAWEDPRLGLGLVNIPTDTFDLDQEPMTQKLITLSQKLPWFGKSDLKTRRAALKAVKLAYTAAMQERMLIRNLADSYYELGFIADSQTINKQQVADMDNITQIASSRYAAGKGLQQDVLQAQVEHSRLLEEANALKQKRRVAEDRINALLNRDNYIPIEPPTLDKLPQHTLTASDMIQAALASNPELAGLHTEIEMADVETELAGKAYYPDPDVMISYGQRDADAAGNDRADFVSGTIVFSLPVWAKQKQGRNREAALKRHDAAKLQYQDLADQLPFRIDSLVTELEQIRANYQLYSQAVVLQAEQWAESAMIAYKVGKTDFNAMMSARLRVLTLSRQEKQYLYRYYQKMTALEEVVGLPTPAEPSAGPMSDGITEVKESPNSPKRRVKP